mgnify:FL=1
MYVINGYYRATNDNIYIYGGTFISPVKKYPLILKDITLMSTTGSTSYGVNGNSLAIVGVSYRIRVYSLSYTRKNINTSTIAYLMGSLTQNANVI